MRSLRDRIWRWLLGRSSLSRLEIAAIAAMSAAVAVGFALVPADPTIKVLDWVIRGLVLLLVVYLCGCLVINRRRRK